MMELRLEGLQTDCVIGDLADERTRKQTLRIDARLWIDDRASFSDSLSDTADYAALARSIAKVLEKAECRMIERAARLAAETCLEDPRVLKVEATVTKRGAVPGLESASAVCTVSRES